MSEYDAKLYEQYSAPVNRQVNILFSFFVNVKSTHARGLLLVENVFGPLKFYHFKLLIIVTNISTVPLLWVFFIMKMISVRLQPLGSFWAVCKLSQKKDSGRDIRHQANLTIPNLLKVN